MCRIVTQHCVACRVILTDLSSLNGTWVNRAKLRAHADSQIQAQDVIAFGSSDATFQLVALDCSVSNLPSAMEVAEAMLGSAQHASDHPESASTQHPDLSVDLLRQWEMHAARYSKASSRADQCRHLLQVIALYMVHASDLTGSICLIQPVSSKLAQAATPELKQALLQCQRT